MVTTHRFISALGCLIVSSSTPILMEVCGFQAYLDPSLLDVGKASTKALSIVIHNEKYI